MPQGKGYKQETPLDLFSFSCFLQVSISVEQASPSPSYKRTDYGNSSIWWTHPSHPILKPLERWINSHNVVISDGLNSKDKNQSGLWINRRQHLNRRLWFRLDLWATPTLWLWQSQSRWASRSLRYMVVNRFRFAWCVRHWFKGCNMLSMNHIAHHLVFSCDVSMRVWKNHGLAVLGTSSQDLHLPGHHLHWSRCSQVSGHGTQCSVHDSTWRKKTPNFEQKKPPQLFVHGKVWYHEVIIFCLFMALPKPYRVYRVFFCKPQDPKVPSQHITSDKKLRLT